MNRCICDESDLSDSAEALRAGPPWLLQVILFRLLALVILTTAMIVTCPAA